MQKETRTSTNAMCKEKWPTKNKCKKTHNSRRPKKDGAQSRA